MTNVNEIFRSSDSLKAEDLDGSDVILTIASVEVKEFSDDDGKSSRKPVIHFEETDKTFVSNKTNSLMIAEHHGEDLDLWEGKQITLYPTKTDFGGKMVDCIRIRPPMTGKKVSKGLPGGRPVGGMAAMRESENPADF